MTQSLRCCTVSRQSSLDQWRIHTRERESQHHNRQIMKELQLQQQLSASHLAALVGSVHVTVQLQLAHTHAYLQYLLYNKNNYYMDDDINI